MASEWRTARLRDVLGKSGYIRGPFGSALRRPELKTQGVPVYEQQHAITGTREFRFFIDEQKHITLRRFTVQEDDLIISCSGTLGRVSMIGKNDPKGIISQALLLLRPDTTVICPKYLFYFLSSKQGFNSIVEVSTGSVQVNIARRDIIENTSLPLPPLPEQRAIAAILGALDDKIELNRRINATLEATARALFKSWFVDFDPVRAKAAGQQPPGLAPHIADLFPDEFVDSELGEIPKGWGVTNLGKQVNAAKGLSYKGEYLCHEGEGLPLHNLNSVYEGGGYKFEGMKWYSGEYQERHLLEPGDVIVTNTEQGFEFLLIGYAAIVPKRFGPKGLFSHHLYRLRPCKDSCLPPWFFYLLLRTSWFHQIVAGYSNGTTVNMLPADGMQKPLSVYMR